MSKEKHLDQLKEQIQTLKGDLAEREIELSAQVKKREALEKDLKQTSSFNNSRDNEKYEIEKKFKISEYNLKKVQSQLSAKSLKLDKLKIDYEKLQEISQSLKDGKTDKSDQLKEKLLQIENLERGIRSSENEISKLKQQISTLNSINSKVEDNYKKLLREKSEELDQNHQNSSQKAKEIQDLSDTVTALENHILQLKEKLNQAVSDGEHWRSKDLANQQKMEGLSRKILAKSEQLAKFKSGVAESFCSKVADLQQNLLDIGGEVSDFARFKNLFLTNFLNKFEQIKQVLSKKSLKIHSMEQENLDLVEQLKSFRKTEQQLEDKKLKIQDLHQMLAQQKQAREELKINYAEEIENIKSEMRNLNMHQENLLTEKYEIRLKNLELEKEEAAETYKHQVYTLNEQLKEEGNIYTQQRMDLESDIGEMGSKVKKVIEDNQKLQKKYAELKRKNIDLGEKLLISESKNKTQLKSLEAENMQLKYHLETLDNQVTNVGSRSREMSSKRRQTLRSIKYGNNKELHHDGQGSRHGKTTRTGHEVRNLNFKEFKSNRELGRGEDDVMKITPESLRARLMGQKFSKR